MNLIKKFEELTSAQKSWAYLSSIRPVLNIRALFHDETDFYRNPQQPDKNSSVMLRFRTAKNNVDSVYAIAGHKSHKMKKTETDSLFDYYSVQINTREENIDYYFEIRSGNNRIYYNQIGSERELNEYYNFILKPGFHTPEWVKGAVMYQIYVDRFCNGDESNDVVDKEYAYIGEPVSRVTNWNKYPEAVDVREFYGGDLQGVINKMDYLKGLGVDCIYFNPLFVSPSNHKYDIQDYDYIDPHFGKIVNDGGEALPDNCRDNRQATKYKQRVTDFANLDASNELFAKVVEEAHSRGMKVIIDGVFNHCGSFNKWLDREGIYEGSEGYAEGAYVSGNSPYRDYFQFNDMNAWPHNNSYDGWWGYDTLPKLNYEGSKALEDYILSVGRKWVSPPYNVDGWRLDVAADLGHSPEYNHDFWRKFRNAVKEANPEAVILAEHYGDAYSWLQGDQWDTVMNYDAFMEPVTWFLTGMEKHSDEFRQDMLGSPSNFFNSMRHNMSRLGGQCAYIAMNELSNHDHSRFLTRTNRTPGRTAQRGPKSAEENVSKAVLREAVTVQMTWPGAPTIYYGDEAGLCGWTDPDNRRTYPWGNEDQDLIQFHRDIINIHKQHKAILRGSYMSLYGDYNVIAFGRFYEDDKIVVAVNNNYEPRTIDIPVWEIGVGDEQYLKILISSDNTGYVLESEAYSVKHGMLNIELPAQSSVILVAK